MTLAEKLQQMLHHEIPLTQQMGIAVQSYDGSTLRLAAPLEPNINHKSTAFGGSLYALAVSCGWGMLHLKLEEASMHKHIVIHEAEIRYLLPVDTDMQAECVLDEAEWQKFMNTLQRHGRARIALRVTIRHQDKAAVIFAGRYVVHN